MKKERQNKNNIKVYALGGLGEIGKNMYALECNDEIIIIDCGIKFPEVRQGVNYLIPDFDYLKENEKKIKALIITHGHEDHIGGIPFLLKTVNIPVVYASGLAIGFIKNKINQHRNLHINLEKYTKDSSLKFKNFEVTFFRTNHSIPDSFGIAIKTNLGYIVHTGDFKFDLTPIGPETEYYKIAKLGHDKVLLLLSDSTNALKKSMSLSESIISNNIQNLFKDIKGRIIIATFASNVYRVQQIVAASVACGRKVIVFGRSMEKALSISRDLKYIKAPENTFIKPQDLPHLPPNKLTIISTGSQGEPLAALSRIAEGTHRQIKIMADDTIIFSSSAIPGNQQYINTTINKLYKKGANIITNSPLADTHTSGHASSIELLWMLNLLKPKYFMPIHGEYTMLRKHINLALKSGVQYENCFLMKNGDVLTLSKNKASMGTKIKSGISYIGNDGQEVTEKIVRERRAIAEDGIVSLVLNIHNNKLLGDIHFTSRGFIYMKESEEMISKIESRALEVTKQYLVNKKLDKKELEHLLEKEIGNYIDEICQMKPMIVVSILNLDKMKNIY